MGKFKLGQIGLSMIRFDPKLIPFSDSVIKWLAIVKSLKSTKMGLKLHYLAINEIFDTFCE